MNLQTFKAPTMAQALAQVKTAMGHDAVILHTRTYQRSIWLGLRRRSIVEITAGHGLNQMAPRRPARRSPIVGPAMLPPMGAASMKLSSPIIQAPYGVMSKQLLETPAAGRVMITDLSDQMSSLKTMVKELTFEVARQKKPHIPEELFESYTLLLANQVCEELASQLIASLHANLRPDQRQQPLYIAQRLADLIEKMIPIAGPITRSKASGPHVVALIGPTGVGKTTTIAKLAANLKLRDKRRIGLITIDTFRIAAIDQLKKYADILGANLRIVSTPEDLRSAIDSMSDCEYVLIDTAGRSPNDALKLHELKNFIASAAPDEVHLVLATTSSYECVQWAIERFSDVRVDRMIFTKLDEAPHAGLVLNVVHKVNKPISYITTGQDVPDDIETGQGRRLVNRILGSQL